MTSSLEYKESLLYPELYNFYVKQKNIYKILPILSRSNSELSLSLIDFFVTNYSKKYNISYKIGKENFDVYSQYKSILKLFSKKLCDPFCRSGNMIMLKYEHDKSLETTFKQLIFLRWALTNKVIKYIEENIDEIKQAKKDILDKKNKIKTKEVNRTLLVTASNIVVKKYDKIIITFN